MAKFKLRNAAPRLAAGAFILNSGLEKRGTDPESAAGLHGMAAGAYPFLADVEPTTFVKGLSAGEIAVGAALLAPVVSTGLAGIALTGFAAGLVGLYARTPSLHQGDSLKPNQDGIPIAKDIWLLGIGVGLLLDALRKDDDDGGED